MKNKERLETFTLESIPNLDTAVLGALELFSDITLPSIPDINSEKLLVVGSGNAEVTGKIIFRGQSALFANESTYTEILDTTEVAEVILISASGGKDSVAIAKQVRAKEIPQWLFTTNSDASAKIYFEKNRVVTFPKNREPYTYNTSAYLGMILAKTKEDATTIHDFITTVVAKIVPTNLSSYNSFLIIIPSEFEEVKDMLLTKFDELFGGMVAGRVFTEGEVRHAKTVIPSETELYINLGTKEGVFEDGRSCVTIPLPERTSFATLISVGYFVIGKIQEQHPPYFKEHIAEYVETASKMFEQTINPIVE